ncbi:PilZ domain-containing protein [Kiloniella antarctica]|uniref:PilZ domain-containing protein n=1 Tax=Kiloniella antarctica TaxID=1550907 RepID=A0ABW5BNF5_9PROT
MVDSSTERRLFPRYCHDFKALINIDGDWVTTNCRDISGCGIRFISDLRPTLKTSIQVHIDNLGRFEGTVLRFEEDGFIVHLNASEFIMQQLADQLSRDFVGT